MWDLGCRPVFFQGYEGYYTGYEGCYTGYEGYYTGYEGYWMPTVGAGSGGESQAVDEMHMRRACGFTILSRSLSHTVCHSLHLGVR